MHDKDINERKSKQAYHDTLFAAKEIKQANTRHKTVKEHFIFFPRFSFHQKLEHTKQFSVQRLKCQFSVQHRNSLLYKS